MRFGFSILPAFLRSFGGRKVPSSSRNTHLPNIFARRNPHLAARSARLRATKSAARIRNRPPAAACMTWSSSGFAAHGATKPHGGGNPTARPRRAAARPLRRCNTVLVAPPAKHPQPPQLPGAYVPEPSSLVVPGFPDQDQDDGHLTPLVQQKLFLDALYAGRQALLHAAGERQKEAAARRRAEDAEYRRLLERDSGRAQAAHRRAEDEEFARLLGEDRRRAQAAHRRAVDEDFARLLEEDRRRAQEAQRRAEAREAARRAREQAAEEKRRRRAEREEAMERARREREREHREREREHRERECYSSRVAVTGAADVHPDEWLRRYEVKWAALRSDVTRIEPFSFHDVPWPVFWDAWSAKDIVEEHVVAFMRHLLPDCEQGQGGGLAKSLRSEILRWHPDKFKGQVLDKVVECDREGVREAAEKVARILTQLNAEMRQP